MHRGGGEPRDKVPKDRNFVHLSREQASKLDRRHWATAEDLQFYRLEPEMQGAVFDWDGKGESLYDYYS